MEFWKEYILQIVTVSLGCGLILQILPQSGKKELLHLICGIILSVMILQPVSDIRPEDYLTLETYKPAPADTYLALGKEAAENWQRQYITDRCEAYIFSKAKAMGSDVSASITVDESGLPVFARLYGTADPTQRETLERILLNDMGITKENQLWTGNPEKGESESASPNTDTSY